MSNLLKAFSLVGVAFVYLLAALIYSLLAGSDQGPSSTGFGRLGSSHWLVAALLALMIAAFAELVFRSCRSRSRRQVFRGGVLVGVGLSVGVTVDGGFGVVLSMAGGCLAIHKEVERGGASP